MSDHAHEEHHGIGHVVPVKVLLGVFGTLIALTILTVVMTKVHIPSPWNLVVAMGIATTKATLVCAWFMHLKYDRLMHTICVLTALLFFLLFVAFTMMDSSQYQRDLRWDQNTSEPNF